MANSLAAFSPDILHSYSLLENYLLGEQTNNRVRDTLSQAAKYSENNWLGKWKVIPLAATYALKTICALYAKVVSSCFFVLGLKTWSYQLWTRAELAANDPELDGFLTYGNNLLAPAINSYSTTAIDVYMQPRLFKSDIRDSQVRALINPFRYVLRFDENEGMCRGAVLWFLRHYFKTQYLFSSSREHLRALGQLFASGIPAEAALVYHLCPDKDFLEFASSDPIKVKIPQNDISTAKIQTITKALQNLEPGAYFIHAPKHAMAYICTEENRGYFFDPNAGTIAIENPTTVEQCARDIEAYFHKTSSDTLDFERLIPCF